MCVVKLLWWIVCSCFCLETVSYTYIYSAYPWQLTVLNIFTVMSVSTTFHRIHILLWSLCFVPPPSDWGGVEGGTDSTDEKIEELSLWVGKTFKCQGQIFFACRFVANASCTSISLTFDRGLWLVVMARKNSSFNCDCAKLVVLDLICWAGCKGRLRWLFRPCDYLCWLW